ncbi:MAG: hypothetical protein OEV44_00200 [Spirochaetota bacterium]|nr:hypothetical protein [Spirochaetota bacterium]
MIQFEPAFKIGQKVYHICSESDKGIIVDITYSVRTKIISYQVIFGRTANDDVWCNEFELSESIRY